MDWALPQHREGTSMSGIAAIGEPGVAEQGAGVPQDVEQGHLELLVLLPHPLGGAVGGRAAVSSLYRRLQLRDFSIVHEFLTKDCCACAARSAIGGWRRRPGTRNDPTAAPAPAPCTHGRAGGASRLPPDRPSVLPAPSVLVPMADTGEQT